ncbi:DNA-binding transcriptional ArsR family regulator [Actinoalloteichus hoggarensis]|uniref:Helix-turn-helix domain protein n=1 Tax=Actinoalloteichus hoggarensis TaxID=1470176 RepID=A0A221W610_9PSEU|nr:helix-turn-helix transcriptional regulator [Actinoalloteichus hoggarensis]ASO21151.1 Helix-turn-helix domain protein [Actinoalloteichus hoggarensis]MBB5921080.1 DNA-binding transcriptional ArsR family regulator [Actinoalloteichus hoggarensis]
MTVRLEFERADLLNIRLAAAADPMWELTFGVRRLRPTHGVDPRYAQWHHGVRTRSAAQSVAQRTLAMAWNLMCPEQDTAVQTMSADRLRTGCAFLAEASSGPAAATACPLPAWVARLAASGEDRPRQWTTIAQRAYELVVRPHWTTVADLVSADRLARGRTMVDRGVGDLLAGLPGVIRWDGTVLELRSSRDRTVRLGGAGLTLVPSYFCGAVPTLATGPERTAALVYPVGWPGPIGSTPPDDDRLEVLFGRTRARCLRLLRSPHTTSMLAAAASVSLGTASRHATALRKAGMITSSRRGGAVLHRVTPLGLAVLAGRHSG